MNKIRFSHLLLLFVFTLSCASSPAQAEQEEQSPLSHLLTQGKDACERVGATASSTAISVELENLSQEQVNLVSQIGIFQYYLQKNTYVAFDGVKPKSDYTLNAYFVKCVDVDFDAYLQNIQKR